MDRNQHGCIQIYCGDGKGKTTAAVGQCIRAVGNEIPVQYVQFLKDGTSGEINVLLKLPGVEVDYAKTNYGFFYKMTEITKKEAAKTYNDLLLYTIERCKNRLQELYDGTADYSRPIKMILVLDEVIASYNYALIEKDVLVSFLKDRPMELEIILTGRNPAEELVALADYVSDIQKKKHPFDKGLPARIGIEQ